ncbi:porin family protein [Pantoea coffeiphila]|nr:porin family protein [Pantoea coffeiphila]
MPVSRFIISNGMNSRLILLTLSSIVAANSSIARAEDREDTRRLLEMNVQRQAVGRERDLLREQQQPAAVGTFNLNGQTWQVERTAPALGQALYMALLAHEWIVARRLLNDYLTLPDREPLLVHYAQGTLARADGDYDRAIAEYRAALALKADFLLAKLELARTLFLDGQDREADRAFAEILASFDSSDTRTAGVSKTITAFREALEQRQAWSGAISFGPEWSDNINRTTASRTCLFATDDGFCFYERVIPEAISSTGTAFDASVQRRIPVYQHHGLYIRSQLFGTQYRTQGTYNETTFNAQAGYSFRKGRQQIAIAPTFEYYEQSNHALYGAWGAHAEWTYLLSAASMFKLEGDYRDRHFRQQGYAENLNGGQTSYWATYYHSVSEGITLFGGVDFTDSDARSEYNGYRQKGVRLGVSAELPAGFQATLFTALRKRDYDVYNPLIEEQRLDREQNYVLVVKAQEWKIAGFVPMLIARHNKVKSNVDWLYSYDRNDIGFKLEYAF